MTSQTSPAHRSRLTLIGTGGTIASRCTERGVVAQLSTAELLKSLDPALLPADADVDLIDVGTRPSFALTLTDMLQIARAAVDAAQGGADGVVVLHGTDSMEETSFLTDLLHAGGAPIVFTGAQRPFDHSSADGPSNMLHALSTAADPAAHDRGVLLAFHHTVWPARGVRKVHTTDLAAFAQLGHAPLDLSSPVAERPRSTVPEALALTGDLPRVDVVAGVPGGDGSGIRAAVAAGARAVVFQGLGIGNAGPGDTDAVRDAVSAGVPVLVTTRVVGGAVEPVYGAGGGADLAEAGAVFASELSPWQTRVLAAIALAAAPGEGIDVVRRWLERTR